PWRGQPSRTLRVGRGRGSADASRADAVCAGAARSCVPPPCLARAPSPALHDVDRGRLGIRGAGPSTRGEGAVDRIIFLARLARQLQVLSQVLRSFHLMIGNEL